MKASLTIAAMLLTLGFFGTAQAGDVLISVKASVNCGAIKGNCIRSKRKKMHADARKKAKKLCKERKMKFKGGSLQRNKSACKYEWKANDSGQGGTYRLTCDYRATCK